MPKPYSDDLRERVIEAVVAGASRREAAESFSLRASSAVRWLQRWYDTGNARAKLSGGSTSPLGGARGMAVGSGSRATGSDLGRDRCGDAQATNSRQSYCGLAIFRAT